MSFVKIGAEKGVMKLCPYIDFSSDRFRIQCRTSSVEATQ